MRAGPCRQCQPGHRYTTDRQGMRRSSRALRGCLAQVRSALHSWRDPATTGYRPVRLNSSRSESNQAMTSRRFQRLCLPIIKQRPGSLAGVSVQRRLLDLEQCADFLTAWAATAQENQVTRLPPVPSRGDSAGRHGTKGLRSGRTRSPAPARNGHRHHPRPADRSGSWAAADTTLDRPPQRPSELVGRPTPPGRRPRADAGRRTGSRYPGAGIGTRAPPGTRQVHTRPHTGAP
jgi:hypothetical protein